MYYSTSLVLKLYIFPNSFSYVLFNHASDQLLINSLIVIHISTIS